MCIYVIDLSIILNNVITFSICLFYIFTIKPIYLNKLAFDLIKSYSAYFS